MMTIGYTVLEDGLPARFTYMKNFFLQFKGTYDKL